MIDHTTTPTEVLSDEDARRAATMHQVYRYLLELAARKEAAERAKSSIRPQLTLETPVPGHDSQGG